MEPFSGENVQFSNPGHEQRGGRRFTGLGWTRACLHLSVIVVVNNLASAQTPKPAFSDPSAPPFLVRLQRTVSDHNSCILVRRDGLFHLERETRNGVDVHEGSLDDVEMAGLQRALNDKSLAALTQQKIPVPLVIRERDVFRVSILRTPFTQNLTFPDPESRRTFDAFISPLLYWMDALQKHPHTTLDEFSGRNNCLPPRKPELTKRPSEGSDPDALAGQEYSQGSFSSAAGGTPPLRNSFLIRWQVEHIIVPNVEDTCIVVYPSGRYRMEKSTQSYRDKPKVRVFVDFLDHTQLQELQELLDQTELKASTHRNYPGGKTFREGEITTISVDRDGHVQQLGFASYFGVPGWVSNISSGTDPEERLVAPLRKWLKTHIEIRKVGPLKDAMATHCVPESE